MSHKPAEALRRSTLVSRLKATFGEEAFREVLLGAALLAITLVLFFPVLVRPAHTVYGEELTDNDFDYLLSLEQVVREGYSAGEWPLWNPYLTAGQAALGNPQSAALYPPMMLLRSLPLWAAFNWSAVLHVWLAGLGMYALMRSFSVARPASLASAFAYMFSGHLLFRFMAGQSIVVHVYPWAAWTTLFYRMLLDHRRWRDFLLTIVCGVLAILSGHLQYVLIVLLVPALYFLVFAIEQALQKKYRALWSGLLLSLTVAVLALALTAIQLVPTYEAITQSLRVQDRTFEDKLTVGAIAIPELPTIAVPYLWYFPLTDQQVAFGPFFEYSPYAGMIMLLLAGAALLAHRPQRRRQVIALAVLGVVGLAVAMGSPLYTIPVRLFPFIRLPGRFSLLWVFAVSALGGFGLEGLMQRHEKTWFKGRLQTDLLFVICAAWILAVGMLLWAMEDIVAAVQAGGFLYFIETRVIVVAQFYNVITVALVVVLLLGWIASGRQLSPANWAWAGAAIVLVEMLLFAAPQIRPHDFRDFYDPAHPVQSLSIDPAQVRLSTHAYANYLIPTHSGIVNNALGPAQSAKLATEEVDPLRRENLLASGYRLTTGPMQEDGWILLEQHEGAYLYHRVGAWPRLYAAPFVEQVSREGEALRRVLAAEFNPYQVAVVVGSPPPESLNQASGAVEFAGTITQYGLNRLSAEVSASRPVLVVFSESYFPGWEAAVDGEPARIYRANYAFRGVVVEAGEHVIDMWYAPRSFEIGWKISLMALILLAATAGFRALRKG